MKVSGLLSQFLYQHKQLGIPGIGRFYIDPSVAIPDAADKNFHEFLQNVRFEQKPVPKADDELIDFIRAKTGKIKPLAESDLDSYLSDCKLLLNIGKPLFLEGIGTLQKNKDGRFEFQHGQPLTERVEAMPPEKAPEKHGERKFLYNNEYTNQSSGQSNALRKMLMIAGIFIGLGVIVWGGYLLYSQKTKSTTEITEAVPVSTTDTPSANKPNIPPDSLVNSNRPDSLSLKPKEMAAPGSYKFICEVTSTRQRALSRYQVLQTLNRQYKMETQDSVHFTIYVMIPAVPADTIRIKDSLKAWYWGERERTIRIAQ